MTGKEINSQYLKARRKLVSLIETLKPGEGRLPPERELCEIFGVSRCTLRAVIDEFVLDKRLFRRPRQGAFVGYGRSGANVGVLLGNGATSRYSGGNLATLQGALNEISARDASSVILTAKNPEENLKSLLRKFSLDGLIWIVPPCSATAALDEALAEAIPLAVSMDVASSPRGNRLKSNYIFHDLRAIGKMRARFFLDRGLERLCYVGDASETFEAFSEELSVSGVRFDRKLYFRDLREIEEKLPRLIDAGLVDGVVSDGPAERIAAVFAAVELFKPSKRPVLQIDVCGEFSNLRKGHPDVKIAALNNQADCLVAGARLAKMFFRALETGLRQPPEGLTQTQTLDDDVPARRPGGVA